MWLLAVKGFLYKNPIAIKILVALIASAFFLFAARWYANREYYKGVEVGVKQGAESLRKEQEASWKEKEKIIAAEQRRVETDRGEIEKKEKELSAIRKELNSTLIKIRTESKVRQDAAAEIVSSVPSDLLDDAIRKISARLGPPPSR